MSVRDVPVGDDSPYRLDSAPVAPVAPVPRDPAPLPPVTWHHALEANLSAVTREAVKAAALEAMRGGARRLVLDLTRSPYVDSAGIGLLFILGRRARSVGGELVLVGATPEQRELFQLVALDEFVRYADRWPPAGGAR